MNQRLILACLLAAAPFTSVPAVAGPTATLVDVHEIRMAAKAGGAANCSNDGTHTEGYALTGWAVGGPRTALLNPRTLPANLGSAATVTALQQSYDVWTGAPRITVATSTGSATKPTANRTYELMFGRTSRSALAVTYTWRWSDGTVESDTIFNSGVAWRHLGPEGDGCYESAGSGYDVANIATHEFGHTYGLDHPADARYETMYAYGYSGETLKRSPTAGDLLGIAAIY